MATPILEDLLEASYRGAFFFLTGSSIKGGRKDAKNEIVNSDAQVVEDLGLRQPAFTISALVAARDANDTTYKQMRDELLDALQAGGRGQLVHPFYGVIDNVVCRSFTISESPSSVGFGTLSINFEISNVLGVPVALTPVLGTIATAAKFGAEELAKATETFTLDGTFAGNHVDAINKVNEVLDAVNEVASTSEQVAGEINSFSAFVAGLAANTAALIAAPSALAEAVKGAVASVNGLLQVPSAVFDAMKGLFDFGDLDTRFSTNTAGGKQRQKNRDLLNTQVQGQALLQAYVSAAQLDLPTVDDIDDTAAILETQFQKIAAASVIDRNSFDAMISARGTLTEFFNAQRATKPRRVTIEAHTVPARVLSYTHYGSSTNGPEIARLNGFRDEAFVEGEIEILSS